MNFTKQQRDNSSKRFKFICGQSNIVNRYFKNIDDKIEEITKNLDFIQKRAKNLKVKAYKNSFNEKQTCIQLEEVTKKAIGQVKLIKEYLNEGSRRSNNITKATIRNYSPNIKNTQMINRKNKILDTVNKLVEIKGLSMKLDEGNIHLSQLDKYIENINALPNDKVMHESLKEIYRNFYTEFNILFSKVKKKLVNNDLNLNDTITHIIKSINNLKASIYESKMRERIDKSFEEIERIKTEILSFNENFNKRITYLKDAFKQIIDKKPKSKNHLIQLINSNKEVKRLREELESANHAKQKEHNDAKIIIKQLLISREVKDKETRKHLVALKDAFMESLTHLVDKVSQRVNHYLKPHST